MIVDTISDTKYNTAGLDGIARVCTIVASGSGTLQSIGINVYPFVAMKNYGDPTYGNIQLVIYPDNGSGSPQGESPLSTSASTPALTSGGWLDISMPGSVQIVEGTMYHIGFQCASPSFWAYYDDNVNVTMHYCANTYGSFPNPWTTVDHSEDDIPNMRMSYVGVLEHDTQSQLLKTVEVTHDTKSQVLKTVTLTHDTEVLSLKTVPITHDTKAQLGHVKTHVTRAMLVKTIPLTHETEAQLIKTVSSTHGTKSQVVLRVPKTHDTEAQLLKTVSMIQHVKSLLLKTAISITHSTKAQLVLRFSETHETQAQLLKCVPIAHATKALLLKTVETAHDTKAQLVLRFNLVHYAKSQLLKTIKETHFTKALLLKTLEKTHFTKALILKHVKKTHYTKALLLKHVKITHYTKAQVGTGLEYPGRNNYFQIDWLTPGVMIRTGKTDFEHYTVLNSGTSWVVTFYDAASTSDFDASHQICAYKSVAGVGTFKFERVCINGLGFKSTGTHAGNTVVISENMT